MITPYRANTSVKCKEIHTALVSTLPATAANYGVFYIADRACQVVRIDEAHAVIGSDAGAVSLDIEKLTSTQALDGGVTVTASPLSLKATANVTQTATLSATVANTILAAGDRLALKDTGVLTAVAGLCVNVVINPIDS